VEKYRGKLKMREIENPNLFREAEKMTQLLQNAFNEASRLPEMDQNALAKWLLEEIHSERRWEKAFAESEDVLERLADEALEEKQKP
jgi:hypothetical protein